MKYLYSQLKTYEKSDFYPFHMPGHKRNPNVTGADLPYGIDITEIEGFDDLHHADGILLEAEKRAARVYSAEETHYLVNGSTAGLLSAVMGCTARGSKILMARNCHKSVYNAVYMKELYPIYIYPEFDPETELNGEIRPEKVRLLLEENKDVQAVVITSPTYDGAVSDTEEIARIAHERGIPLIVDEAHGAHFGFHPYFPDNSNAKGADVVIHSIHKTMPSLTQTALIHMNGKLADRKKIRKYLHIIQTSSPSYVLMSAIDECIRLLEENKDRMFENYTGLLREIRNELSLLKNMRLVQSRIFDRSKLTISVKDTFLKSRSTERIIPFTGRDLYIRLLKEYHLQAEMAAGSYVIAMTAPGDTREGMKRLAEALTETDRILCRRDPGPCVKDREFGRNEQVYTVWEAENMRDSGKVCTEHTVWNKAAGKTALEYAYLYPPGIPLVVPGERISEDTAEQIRKYREAGFRIEGTEKREEIEVLKDG